MRQELTYQNNYEFCENIQLIIKWNVANELAVLIYGLRV